jgi:hypothetical protein
MKTALSHLGDRRASWVRKWHINCLPRYWA